MGELGREGPGKEKKGEKSNFLTNPFVKLQMKQKNDGLYMNAAKDCSEIVFRFIRKHYLWSFSPQGWVGLSDKPVKRDME